jgi:hypothetical protein
MYLVGMGGHNIQEVIIGLTSSIIMLHTVFEEIISNSNPNLIRTIFNHCDNDLHRYPADAFDNPGSFNRIKKYNIFTTIINMVRNCKPFVDFFYERTKGVNITGVFNNVIYEDSFNDMYDDLNDRLKELKTLFINNYFTTQNVSDKQFQMFVSLESDRYLLPEDVSFNRVSNEFVKFTIDNDNLPSTVPLSFKSSSTKPKKTKPKSPPARKKSPTIRRKSPTTKRKQSPARKKSPTIRCKSPTTKRKQSPARKKSPIIRRKSPTRCKYVK